MYSIFGKNGCVLNVTPTGDILSNIALNTDNQQENGYRDFHVEDKKGELIDQVIATVVETKLVENSTIRRSFITKMS